MEVILLCDPLAINSLHILIDILSSVSLYLSSEVLRCTRQMKVLVCLLQLNYVSNTEAGHILFC